MDWETRLAADSNDQLQQRARNAAGVLASNPPPEKAAEAERVLRLIDAERARRSLPGNIASFLEAFPLGFRDPKYRAQERDDKVAASEACRAALTDEAFRTALANDLVPLLLEIKKLVNLTNLIQGSFEKPKLLDAIQDSRHSKAFIINLQALLYGHGEAPERLQAFSDFMHGLGLRKWTYGTYFLFLHDPQNCIFVKPEGLKKAVDIAGYPLEYDSEPTADIYRRILGFAHWISSHLRDTGRPELDAKDMIDVQSFMWHMAPTGKFAR
ncbi:hypothetical protein K3217_20925 [bacterium BD-1]|nr:hypothetical protein [Ottowia caeni]